RSGDQTGGAPRRQRRRARSSRGADHRHRGRDDWSRRSRDAAGGRDRARRGAGGVPRPAGAAAPAPRPPPLGRGAQGRTRCRAHGRTGGPCMSDVRERLALALAVGGPDDAEALARRLAPWFGIAKVGMELYAEAGPAMIEHLRALGFAVFADLKFYDIPNTVERAARAVGRRGVEFLNFPAAGGKAMLEAGVKGLDDGARAGGPRRGR